MYPLYRFLWLHQHRTAALAVEECFTCLKRRGSSGYEVDIFWKNYRKILFRHQDIAAMRAVDDRNRAAPVSLAGNQPVPQTVVDLAVSDSHFLDFLCNSFAGFFRGQSVEFAGIDKESVCIVCLIHVFQLKIMFLVLDNQLDRKIVLFANSQSLWSPCGTAMTAPVPYS